MVDFSISDGILRVRNSLTARGEALLTDGSTLSTEDTPAALVWEADGSILRLRFRNTTRGPVGVEQLRPIVAEHGYADRPLRDLRIQETGWQSWSRAHPPAPFEPNPHSMAPPIRGPYLPHRRQHSQVEPWMTVLESDTGPAMLLGFVSARHQLGTIEIVPTPAGGHALIAATELDGIEVGPGSEVVSEPLLLELGNTADLVERYARRVAEHMQARTSSEVLTGWCSWYELYTTVSEADVDRNLRSLVSERDRLPLRLIQLDDGYQRSVGDWLELNSKFPSGMRALVNRIRQEGLVPGLWLAPFLLSAKSHTYEKHPEWVIRDTNDAPLNAIDNWGSANFALDTTHPDAMAWLGDVLRTVCEEWGFEYLKLDFVYAAAMRGRRHDRQLTGVEAYRRGLEALREVAGDRFILGCGAPLLPSVGLVDGMRIGSDVAAYWGGEVTRDSNGPSLRNATRATLARLWMHACWWINDPDCLVVRAADTELTLAEVQAWASVVALSGGMLFVGDDVSRIDPDRLHLLERLLPPSGRAALARPPLMGHLPERLHLHVQRDWGEWDLVGIANWSDAPRPAHFDPHQFDLDPARFHVFDLWSAEYLGQHSGIVDLGSLEPHSLRLLSVHSVQPRPEVIGSTGHLLGDVMDLAEERWNASRRVLQLVPSSDAPPGRRGEFVVVDPHGQLCRIAFSAADPRPIEVVF